MISSAQISVYPLRQEHLGPTIDMVRQTLEAHGLRAEVGPKSTMVTGDAAIVFAALADAFDKAARAGQVVMTFTVSNACPVPRQPPGHERHA
ncbi:MAG: YkoF family thiamine/hydroxymethylpyrimidine-binding protein [Hyphomicrobiaceae bacterium]